MKIKKIILVLVVLFSAVGNCMAQTDDQIKVAFQKLIDALPTQMQKKQMEQNRDMILNIKDPKARKQLLDMLNITITEAERVIEEQKQKPQEKKSEIVTAEDLKNYKAEGDTIAQLSKKYKYKGLGTKESPFLISEPMELIIAASISNSMDDRYYVIYNEKGKEIGPVNASYKLIKDLDFSKYTWSHPIGSERFGDEYPFEGVFDGDGHSISNLTSNAPLIKTVGVNGVIKNLIIKNANVEMGGYFINASPFCQNNDGAIVTCSFEGSLSGENNVYNIAFSPNKKGVAVCCVANNQKGKTTDFYNIKTFGCDKNLSDSKLNDILSTWNALYTYNGDTCLNSSMHFESGKLVNTKAKEKTIPAKRMFSEKMTFNYAYDIQVWRDLYGYESKVYIENLKKTISVDLWTSDTKVKLESNGGTVSVKNKKLDTYKLTVFVKQEDGSYKPIVLDEKRAYVGEAFDCGTVKGLTINYSGGSSSITLLTEDAWKCLKDGVILPKTENGMEMSSKCYYEYPSKMIVNNIVQFGKW